MESLLEYCTRSRSLRGHPTITRGCRLAPSEDNISEQFCRSIIVTHCGPLQSTSNHGAKILLEGLPRLVFTSSGGKSLVIANDRAYQD